MILRPFSLETRTLRVGALSLGAGARGDCRLRVETAKRASSSLDSVRRASGARRRWRIGSRPARAGSVGARDLGLLSLGGARAASAPPFGQLGRGEGYCSRCEPEMRDGRLVEYLTRDLPDPARAQRER